MNRTLLHEELPGLVRFVFSRSGGKGGQNVNKVNTKVHAFVVLSALTSLSARERALAAQRLASSVNQDGELFVAVQDERSQEMNREIALARLESILVAAAYVPPKRKKTKPTKASRERRLKKKKLHSLAKRSRGAASFDV